jgi:hypothetical protein
MSTLQVDFGVLGWDGKTMVTFLAPPHWSFLIVLPDLEQLERCLQVEPSGMSYWNSKSQSNSGLIPMELSENLSMSAPQPKEGDCSFTLLQEPLILFPVVRGAKRLVLSDPQVNPFQLKLL